MLSAEYNSAESLTNKYKLFGTKSKETVNISIHQKTFSLTPSKKYIIIEEFKNRLKGLKNTFNEIKKKLELLREKENKTKNQKY